MISIVDILNLSKESNTNFYKNKKTKKLKFIFMVKVLTF